MVGVMHAPPTGAKELGDHQALGRSSLQWTPGLQKVVDPLRVEENVRASPGVGTAVFCHTRDKYRKVFSHPHRISTETAVQG
jgi:hypothetical protein|mmetsp:Transcript_1196/g.2114  ORF Transcript_1196/g.2114 Transcript_1196/m.2114 type:complete len:82 (-) Transcript_1196:1684-1929(-)